MMPETIAVTAALPVVAHATASQALRHLVDASGDAARSGEHDGLTSELLVIARDNPELMTAIGLIAGGESPEFHQGALMGMAATYNILRAQLEVNALEAGMPGAGGHKGDRR